MTEEEARRDTESEAGAEEERPAPQPVFRCRLCRRSFQAEVASGLACPACGGDTIEKVHVPAGAFEYILADRSQGTTALDVMFAQWAKWCQCITPHQYDVAVHRQNSELQEAGVARPIHEIMLQQGFINDETADGLLRFLSFPRPDDFDRDFVARLLSEDEHVDEARVKEVGAVQQRMAAGRAMVPPLSQLLLSRGVITEVQLLDILREQTREGAGPLRLAAAMAGSVKRGSGPATVKGMLTGRAARKVVMVAVLFAIAATLLTSYFYEPPARIWGYCRQCHAIVKVEAPAPGETWPLKCPVCGYRDLYVAVKSLNGPVFGRQHAMSREPCPVTGSLTVHLLTDEEAAQAKAQKGKPQ